MQLTKPKVTENYGIDGSHTYTFSNKCPQCGDTTLATVEAPDLFKYRQGAHVQAAFPYLTADQREAIFVTGICARCWDNMFPDDDDMDDDWDLLNV